MHVVRLLACVGIVLLAATESAADDSWRIVQSAGVVRAGGAGFMPAAVQPNQSLPRNSWVETGASGRVVLARGLESIILGSNSRVQLPSEEVNGNTQILQSIGSALYQVGKQKAPHFQVDTPNLAAVVKGTTFTITVTEAGSAVEVSEGLVQVATADGSDTEFVQAGFSGIVTKKDSGSVVVVASPRAPAAPGEAAPDSSSRGKSEEARSGDPSEGKGTVIASVIGELTLDIKAVSRGLATSVEAPTLAAPDKDKKAADETGGEKDRLKETAGGGGRADDGPILASGPVDAAGVVAEPVGGNGNSSVDPIGGNGGGGGGNAGGAGNGGGNAGGNDPVGGGNGLGNGGGNGLGNGGGNGLGNGFGGGNGGGKGHATAPAS